MIKYIGSKRKLLPHIVDVVRRLPDVTTACDVFAGTTRVGQALKELGLEVHSNDLAAYSRVMGETYVAADADLVDLVEVRALLDHLAALPGIDGYATDMFCRQARYFQPHNGQRIDAIRAEIDRLDLTAELRAIALTSLIEAADRVDSTTGVQMAYLKQWARRSHNDLELRTPSLLAGSGRVTQLDANELARTMAPVDLAYLDPPYNQHSYRGNYHVWETLVRGDEPEAYGIARKRIDCQTEKSAYNSKPGSWPVLAHLARDIPARYLLVSFNAEGFHDSGAISELLRERGELGVIGIGHDRYVGARIGIHSPTGARVGRVSHTRTTEYLFLVGPGAEAIAAEAAAATPTSTWAAPALPA
ncbi:MAG: methyltransferase [Thermoleophilia bacterium]|nr:methyltransferase [Thermoleophilia bacterium]